MNEKLSSCRLGGFMVAAMSGPFVYMAGRQNWTAVLVAALVCTLVYLVVFSRSAWRLLSWPLLCFVEYGAVVVACVTVSGWSGNIWPSGNGWPVVPLTLLALAVASAWSGANRASKTMGVLFWLITILYSILLAFGLRNVQPVYLIPKWEIPDFLSWFVLLLPCTAQFLPRENRGSICAYLIALGGLALLITIWAEGNLSLGVAKQVAWPFYEAGERVRLFGVANRLESFISVGATIGFYGLYSFLLSVAGYLAERTKKGAGKYGVLVGGILSAAGVLLQWSVPYFVLAAGAFVLWVILPTITSFYDEKKCGKEQNNA